MSLHLIKKQNSPAAISLDKLLFSLSLLLLLALSPVKAHGQPSVMILGDSLSAGYGIRLEYGWVSLLQQRLQSHYPDVQLINASISGETTGGALRRLPELLQTHQPDVVLVELGGNDGLRGFPINTINDNLSRILRQIDASGSLPLLLEIQIPPNYGQRYTRLFTDLYAKLAREQQIPLLPFFLTELATEPGMMQEDGIHPTEQAQDAMAAQVQPYIEQALLRLAHQG